MKRAAFRVFASLSANDEEIRKRIIETDQLMESLVAGLEDSSNPKLQVQKLRESMLRFLKYFFHRNYREKRILY
jgi:hypothetical protein